MTNKSQKAPPKVPFKVPDTTLITVSEPVKIESQLTDTSHGMLPGERYKFCPFCDTEARDNGSYHKGSVKILYLKCYDCGHTWKAVVIPPRVVSVDYRLPESISER